MEPSPIGNKEGDFLNIIEAQQLTKDYGNGKGIFDVSLSIKEGEIYGYLGANGAGKSTTMRLLMGFIKSAIRHCFHWRNGLLAQTKK